MSVLFKAAGEKWHQTLFLKSLKKKFMRNKFTDLQKGFASYKNNDSPLLLQWIYFPAE